MQVYDFATHTRSLSCTYQTDTNFSLKGSKNTNQQGINIFQHEALKNARDARINNYSSLILSNELLASDAFALQTLEAPEKRILSTYLAVSITNELNDETRYLYFNNERETNSSNFNEYTSQQMLPLSQIVEDAQRFFNIELIDKQYARVNFKYNGKSYYLAANTNNELLFVSNARYKDFANLNFNFVDETTFFYVLDEPSNTLFLLKPLPSNVTRGVGLSAINATKLELLSTVNATNYYAFNTFNFKIRDNIDLIASKLNTSQAKYNVQNIDDLDILSTTENLPNNILLASQYNAATTREIPTRPLILKNQHSLMSHVDECSYTDLINNAPGTQLREYTTIIAGNEQEKGNDAIAINYVIYANDYVAKPDAYTLFKTSADLYPYTQLNINDSTLVQDGAFGGNNPYISDQLFMQKNDAQGADGQYLCTWLSGSNWVDRYYNNNKMTPLDAAKAVNGVYGTYEDYVQQLLQTNAVDYDFFDKKSDFVFEPDKEYFYYRIGNKRINEQLNNYSNQLLLSSLQWKTSNNQIAAPSEQYICNGNSFAVFENYEAINDAGQMTISFWLDSNNWSEINAHEIVGNVTNAGFGIIKDPVVTPLIMVQSTSAVHILNSDFVEITKTPVSGTSFLTRSDALDAFQAISTSGTIYKLQADGTLYDRKNFDKNIIATAYANDVIYMLHTDGFNATAFNTTTEQTSAMTVDFNSQSIAFVGGALRGFVGTKVLAYDDDAVMFLYNQNQLVYKNYVTNDQYVAFKTLSSSSDIGFIADFALDDEKNLYVLHNNYKLSKFNADRVVQYTISMQSLLSSISATNVGVDVCYEYTGSVKTKSIIVASTGSNQNLSFARLSESGIVQSFVNTSIKKSSTSVFNLTNAQYLQQLYSNRQDAFDFVVKLPNYYNNLDFTTVKYTFNASDFNSGAHHFALRLDAKQGNASFFVDGVLQQNTYIQAAKFMQLPLMQSSICFGATQFSNGNTLTNFLQQQNKYFASNVTLSYPRIYSAALLDNDVKLLYMQKSGVEDINFHLPCGQRNNLDKIKQMFAWGTPGFKSNNIKITVKNSGIVTDTTKQALKAQILQEINSILPVNTNVIDIEFAEFD